MPRDASVARTIDAAIRVRCVDVAERRDKDCVGIFRIDDDAPDLFGVFQSEMFPRFARVVGFVDAVTEGNRVAHVGFAGADVNHVRIRRRDADCADRGNVG